jgi:hypothetical protein
VVMKRSLEAVDVMAVVSLLATVFSGYLLFLVAEGTLGRISSQGMTTSPPTGTGVVAEWVQPALGQAIVQDALLEQGGSKAIASAAWDLNRISLEQYAIDTRPLAYLDPAIRFAVQGEADHLSRVQYVKGRAITNFTARGVRQGWLSADQYVNDQNDRMIRQSDAFGERIDQAFRTSWQERLGEAIVAASRDHAAVVDRLQERVGAAVVQVASVQTRYEEAKRATQDQLVALTTAMSRSEQQTDLIDRLATAESSTGPQAIASTEPKSWPEISLGHVLVASLGLCALFVAGFSIRGRSWVEEQTASVLPLESAERLYRKTA